MRVTVFLSLVALLSSAACSHHRSPRAPTPQLPFGWEARALTGDVLVLQGLGVHPPLDVPLDSFIGGELTEARVAVRTQRMDEVASLPEAVGWALPGAVNGQLGPTWPGRFQSAEWPAGRRERVVAALARGHGLDDALGELARSVGGDGTLVSWVDRLSARPLSAQGFPGDMAHTPGGPVIIDHADEPYLVDLRVGMALIASDGEVVVRYHQDMVSVLSEARPPDHVGRELAADLALEVMKVWVRPTPTDRSPETTRHHAAR